MSKNEKSIFKMQAAGSVPEVNQYGLTEEQMQSVRDNMRRYKISEEEAVANKIYAMNETEKFRKQLLYDTDNSPWNYVSKVQKERDLGDSYRQQAMTYGLANLQNSLNYDISKAKDLFSSYSLKYKAPSFKPEDRVKSWSHINPDENWRIKMADKVNALNLHSQKLLDESNAFANWTIESSKNRNASPNVLAENVKNRLSILNSGTANRINDYNTYKQEYLDSNPIGNYTKPRGWSGMESSNHVGGAVEDPAIVREEEAHKYAISKIRDQYKNTDNPYLSDYLNAYLAGENAKNQYAANILEKGDPFTAHSKSLQNIGKTAAIAGASTLPLYLFLPEFATYKLAAIPRIAGGLAGARVGEKIFSKVGRTIDQMRAFNRTRTGIRLGMEDPTSYKPITSPAYIAEKLSNFKLGQHVGGWIDKNLASQTDLESDGKWIDSKINSGIKNFGNWMDSYEKIGHLIGGFWGWDKGAKAAYGLEKLGWASVLNKPWARKLPQWVTPNALKEDTFNTLLKYNLVRPKMKTTFVNDYQFLPNDPKKLLLSPSKNSNSIVKNQMGGLIYKPYIAEQAEIKQDSSPTLSYEPEESRESFRVEPVRIYTQTTQNTVPEEREVIESPMQEQETPVQVDNTRVQKPVQEYKGKIYKSSEKEQFKEDLYNAYFKALIQRGLDEIKASEFAKRLTTQDILESNWGQSSLSKDFNFGGIKDFSGSGTVKDTTEVVNGKSVKVKQPFRKFANIDEYVNYKINLVDKKWKVFGFNPDKYYSLIVSGKQKYATDPNYVTKLTNLYKQIWK